MSLARVNDKDQYENIKCFPYATNAQLEIKNFKAVPFTIGP